MDNTTYTKEINKGKKNKTSKVQTENMTVGSGIAKGRSRHV